MDSLSVIVTTHNNEAVIERTLKSVEASLAYFRIEKGAGDVHMEVVVSDDGSTDQTWPLLQKLTSGKPFYKLVRRPQSSNASCARNIGVAHSSGSLLFFLDGDDLYLPPHILECYRAFLAKPTYVKTGVQLSDPVHPDWKARIDGSLVINLAVARSCHFSVGGFPDYHLFKRTDHRFVHELDVFKEFEDISYNRLIGSIFDGTRIEHDTVEYKRYPGNSYDRQYEKFSRPYGAYKEKLTPVQRFRLRLNDLIVESLIESLQDHTESEPS